MVIKENDINRLIKKILKEDSTFQSTFDTDNNVNTTDVPQTKTSGTLNPKLFEQLNINGFDINKFNTAINYVKKGQSLNVQMTKTLSDVFVALLKTDDNDLINKIFINIKSLKEV